MSTTRQAKMRPAFYTLHAATLDRHTTADQLAAALRAADAVPDRHRLSEGAVYTAACRRYLMLTGDDWKATQLSDTATTWGGQSDHRLRVRRVEGTLGPDTTVGGWTWACSCGTDGQRLYSTEAEAPEGHGNHLRTC